ncbi:MAG TPA: hypothetical protein VFW40_02010 [Capsulimonadaceae bacterium]|nr:hypothetical protein [Capsulimonadaceae bacterium]
MTKYKTSVVDYEGMQECLDQHAAQGWRLFCVNADTWRKVEGEGLSGPQGAGGVSADSAPVAEYSASYYLLVFFREEDSLRDTALAEAIEELPHHERHRRSY